MKMIKTIAAKSIARATLALSMMLVPSACSVTSSVREIAEREKTTRKPSGEEIVVREKDIVEHEFDGEVNPDAVKLIDGVRR